MLVQFVLVAQSQPSIFLFPFLAAGNQKNPYSTPALLCISSTFLVIIFPWLDWEYRVDYLDTQSSFLQSILPAGCHSSVPRALRLPLFCHHLQGGAFFSLWWQSTIEERQAHPVVGRFFVIFLQCRWMYTSPSHWSEGQQPFSMWLCHPPVECPGLLALTGRVHFWSFWGSLTSSISKWRTLIPTWATFSSCRLSLFLQLISYLGMSSATPCLVGSLLHAVLAVPSLYCWRVKAHGQACLFVTQWCTLPTPRALCQRPQILKWAVPKIKTV